MSTIEKLDKTLSCVLPYIFLATVAVTLSGFVFAFLSRSHAAAYVTGYASGAMLAITTLCTVALLIVKAAKRIRK